MATYYLEKARKHLYEREVNEGRPAACEWLLEARRLLGEAKPDFGDPEVEEHRLEVRRLCLELGCIADVKSSAADASREL